MHKLNKIFLSPYFLAFLFTVIVILFIPPVFTRYRVVLKNKGTVEKPGGKMFFNDLNNDGYSELCILYENSIKRAAIRISDINGAIVNQWNFPGEITPNKTHQYLNFYDRDHNGLNEVYTIVLRNDSVLLVWFEPFGKDKSVKSRFISLFNNKLPLKDLCIDSIKFIDLNHSGSPEAVMTLAAGFGLQPRQIFAYDFDSDSLIISDAFGTIIDNLEIKDIDRDGNIELFGNSSGPGNYNRKSIKYHDSSAWLIIFDNKLKPRHEPIEFPGFGTSMKPFYFSYQNSNHILTYSNNKSIKSTPHQLSLYDSSSKLIKSVNLPFDPLNYLKFLQIKSRQGNEIILLASDGYFYKIMPDLSIKKLVKVPDNKKHIIYNINCNNDETDEVLFLTDDLHHGWIYSSDFSRMTPLQEISFINKDLTISLRKNGHNQIDFCIQTGECFFICNYSLNPLYYLRFLIYIGIYLSVLLIIFIIRKQQQLQLQKKSEMKNKLQILQLRAVNNQLDPHFTFNVINRIGSAVLKNLDKDKTYKLITGFSDYLRNALMQSDKIDLTIREELDNIISYLNLMKSQEVANFEYEVIIGKEADQNILIPKTLIFTFAENALKHGIMSQEKKGDLLIKINKKNELLIEVIDNGQGIKHSKAVDNNLSTGKGLIIIDQIIDLYNNLKKSKITYTIEEITGENMLICGTKVTIKFPEAERYG